MNRRLLVVCLWVTLLASCLAPPPRPGTVVRESSLPPGAGVPEASRRPVPEALQRPKEAFIAPLTLDGYQMEFAQRVARASPDIFQERLPEVLKSIVVLDVTIDRDGRLLSVSVRRSNGYKELETLALDSVRRAAPFAAPARPMRRVDGTVHFLETFLFRNDGRFQIRTLVTEPQ